MRSHAFLATAIRAFAATLSLAFQALPGALPTLAGAGAFLALSGAVIDADASLHLEVTLRHLVTISDLAIEATPQEASSVWEDVPGGGRRIVTYTRLNVHQTVYGSEPKDLWVRTLGGQVGDVGQKVEGEVVLAQGERSVLFIKAFEGTHRVVEMAQGQFVERDEKEGVRLKLSPYLGRVIPDKDEKVRARSARAMLHNKSIADGIAIIRNERKEAGR